MKSNHSILNAVGALTLTSAAQIATADPRNALASLGEKLYFDTSLSTPAGQSCASCHRPGAGFADPDRELPVSRGLHPDRFGDRNTPSAAYAQAFDAMYGRDTRLDWGKPEVMENVNDEELGNLGLTNQEVDDIVAFMKTLSDGYQPE